MDARVVYQNAQAEQRMAEDEDPYEMPTDNADGNEQQNVYIEIISSDYTEAQSSENAEGKFIQNLCSFLFKETLCNIKFKN